MTRLTEWRNEVPRRREDSIILFRDEITQLLALGELHAKMCDRDTQYARAESAEARCAELERDAARYRMLREVDPDAELPTVLRHRQDSWGNWRYDVLILDELDAAIDAAPKPSET